MRRWWPLPFFTLIGAAGAYIALTKPIASIASKYVSQAMVKYESRAQAADTRATGVPREYVALVHAEVDQISKPQTCAVAAHSPALRQALPWLREQNLDDPQAMREISRRLRPMFTTTHLAGSQLVRIESAGEDRAAAAAVCNAFAEALISQCRAHVPRPRETGLDDVRAEMADSEAAVAALEAKRRQVVEQSSTLEIAQQQATLAAQAERLAAQKAKIDGGRVEAASRIDRLQHPSADGIAGQFLRLKQQRMEEQKALDKVYREAVLERLACEKEYASERGSGKTEKHRDVILAADRLHRAEAAVARRAAELSAEIDAVIAAERDAAVASAKVDAAQSRKVADEQIAELDAKIAALDEKSKSLSIERKQREDAKGKIEQIAAEIQAENRRYEQLGQQLRESIAKVKTPATFDLFVVHRATVDSAVPLSAAPATPVLGRIGRASIIWLSGGFAAGLLFTVATAGLSFPRRREAPAFPGGPILGSIPIATPVGRSSESDRKSLQLCVAESFRNLRDNVLSRVGDLSRGEPHTLCVTSPHRGDGRSCIAVGLAISLAKAGRRVLLVDGDLRNPTLHRIFAMERSPGFAELIEGAAEPDAAMAPTTTDNLTLLRAGTPSVDPGQLLAWQDIAGYVESVASRFDHVIIDLGPLLESADSHHLIGCCKAVVLVFPPTANPQSLERAVNMLRDRKVNLLGAVRNRA